MSTLAVIPSRYDRHRLMRLLMTLTDCDVLVLDNGHEPPLWKVPHVEDARGMGIYAMWNRGWRTARERGYSHVAILNDDIRIVPGTIGFMEQAFRALPRIGVVYPDWPLTVGHGLPRRLRVRYTSGTVTDHGMTGFCFMFPTDLPVPPFDERFEWWYGDDLFEREVRKAGFYVARLLGLPCEHESDSEANEWARRPELKAATERDRERWLRLRP